MELKGREITEVKEAREHEMTLKERKLAESKASYVLFVEIEQGVEVEVDLLDNMYVFRIRDKERNLVVKGNQIKTRYVEHILFILI